MGVFGTVKRLIGGGSEEDEPAYECGVCGTPYETARDVCDNCGSREVRAT